MGCRARRAARGEDALGLFRSKRLAPAAADPCAVINDRREGAAFRLPFHAGQRGIVIFRTFNEGEEVMKPSGKTETRQWTVDPQDGQPRGFAFLWRQFEIPGLPAPILACVMATVPANELIRRTIKSQEEDPRMPAILDDDVWATWLGEDNALPAVAKDLLKTMEGVNWQAAPEPKKPRARKASNVGPSRGVDGDPFIIQDW